MSMGGCYISIEEDIVKSLVTHKKSLSSFIFDEQNELSTYSLEQAWDAFRILFSGFDILGVYPLENVDLGEECFFIKAREVKELSLSLNMTSPQELREIMASDEFQNEEFYWDSFWKQHPEDLIKMVDGLKFFFCDAANNNHSLLFYLG
jgi:Domain of unknown function (DUF1877)